MTSSPANAASTPASSPPPETMERKDSYTVSANMEAEEKKMREASRKQDEARNRKFEKEREQDMKGGKNVVDTKFKALEFLLSQSKLYSTIMLSQMQKQEQAENNKDEKDRKRAEKREEKAEKVAQASQRRSTRTAVGVKAEEEAEAFHEDQSPRKRGRGRPVKLNKETSTGKITDYIKKEDLVQKAGKTSVKEALEEEAAAINGDGVKPGDIGVQNLRSARQPDLVTGGTMRGYQLEGLEWLTSLYENGLNGILADEMGLGKTIQTISFLAFLRERGINGPFLIAAPLSTTSNWIDEFQRWTPSIPAVLYHGSKQEREEIRRKRLKNPGSKDFPVICTSYEICMNDRKFLAHYGWKYIIIDEGHRIKNLNCRLIQELQSYQSANRLLITGTPLQNNLAELWSLLHFLMPDIFDKLESFESWFDFSALKEKNGYEQILSEERRSSLVSSLHAILKPFLLRRIKADVEHSMPKKREYVLYAPLTTEQRELYEEILHGNSRSYLEEKVFENLSRNVSGANTPVPSKSRTASLKRKEAPSGSGASTPNKSAKTSRASTPATNGTSGTRGLRNKKQRNYEEVSDRAYFKHLENSDEDSIPDETSEDQAELQRSKTLALAKRLIAQKKLQNPIMQLRLCCNSPHNFYDPFPDMGDDEEDPITQTTDYTPLITSSGKMILLDRLLQALLSSPANHKILIFSQFKTQLDLLDLYLTEIRKTTPCRIDGSIANTDRRDQIHRFNSDPDSRVFLLSTRAGGQGINLAAADTVILYDSDWNPQQDLQAQDRAHRIGQRRNVIVYRLATKGTVEEMLLEKAESKRRLEKLVIRKGRFRSWSDKLGAKPSSSTPTSTTKKTNNNHNDTNSAAPTDDDEEKEDNENEDENEPEDDLLDLRNLLNREDGQRLDLNGTDFERGGKALLKDEDVAVLLDRSEEAYVRAEKGLDGQGRGADGGRDGGGIVFKAVETKKGGEGMGLLEGMGGGN